MLWSLGSLEKIAVTAKSSSTTRIPIVNLAVVNTWIIIIEKLY